jgi:hypothetical protein
MPCNANFSRYKNEYSGNSFALGIKPEGEIKTIASPRLMSKLSPLTQMNLT